MKFPDYVGKLRAETDELIRRELKSSFPYETEGYIVRLKSIDIIDPPDAPPDAEKQAILSGSTMLRRIQGEIELVDKNTRKVLWRNKGVLGAVPYITRRGTLIVNGTEYAIPNQLRLAPAVYMRRTADGRYEANVNTDYAHRFFAHRYFYNPENGYFDVVLGGYSVPVVGILRLMGFKDADIRRALGDAVFRINAQRSTDARMRRGLEYMRQRTGLPPNAPPQQVVARFFGSAIYNPELAARALGVDQRQLSGTVTPQDMLLIARRLLDLSQGKARPSDRDNLTFQQIYTPAHQIAQMSRNAAITMARIMARRIPNALRRQNPKAIESYRTLVPPGLVIRYLRNTNLLNNLEEINPLELADQLSRAVRTGQGGIGSVEAIPYSAREVHPSHAGVLDPVRTAETLTAGADLRLAVGAIPGKDNQIYVQLYNPRSRRMEVVPTSALSGKIIALPAHPDDPPGMLPAFVGGRLVYVPKNRVDYQVPSPDRMFSPIGNLVPLRSTVSPIRLNMGSKFYTQALPLVNRETPLVSASDPEGTPYHRHLAPLAGAVYSKVGGTVVDVGKNRIVVKDDRGKTHTYWLYHDFPYNRTTYITNEPVVKPGDRVKPGQLLADSNFTRDGELATGVNARVAFIAWKGLTHEDAFVVSESFAKRMASEHLVDFRSDADPALRRNPKLVMGISPYLYDRTFVNKHIDKDGVVKPGTVVRKGDPLIMQVEETQDVDFKVRQRAVRSYKDRTETWDYETPGLVTDVRKNEDGSVVVLVKSFMPLKVGDKIADRFGTKGVVSAIIPDDQMPKDEEGRPFEVIVDPAAVYSRMNPGQILEAYLGAIAAKTGRPYRIQDMDRNWYEFVRQEMAKHGIKPSTTIIDPDTGKPIRNVGAGIKYFLRLKQKAEDYLQERATGAYSAEGLPSTSAEEDRAKRAGWQELNAILAHGALDVLWDMRMLRGQENQDFWRAFQLGRAVQLPRVPFVWQKFVEMARAGGVNVKQVGDRVQLLALTDRDIQQLAGNRVIENSATVDWQDLRPVRGGLFDINRTGGHNGTLWSKIELPHRYPNPVMEPVIRAILGLNTREFEEVLAGRRKLPDGSTGPDALYEYIRRLDLDALIRRFEQEARDKKGAARDRALRTLSWLKNARKRNVHPADWFWSAVPVLPPIYRPISVSSEFGSKIVADANYLYRDLIEAINAHKMILEAGGRGRKSALNVYLAMRALVGLGEPINRQTRRSHIKGILPFVFGHEAFVSRRLFRTYTDLVGRGVITPDPNLNVDQVGLPEDMAWTLYKPFIIRRLVQQGMSFIDALDAWESRGDEARAALKEEMRRRPVILSRSPVLHKFGMLAHWPVIVSDKTIHMPLLPLKGYGADFDGDQMNVHVPVTEAARREAIERMLPSRNLIDPRQFRPALVPRLDLQFGMYRAAHPDAEALKRPPVYFKSRRDMLMALLRGEIDIDQPVVITG